MLDWPDWELTSDPGRSFGGKKKKSGPGRIHAWLAGCWREEESVFVSTEGLRKVKNEGGLELKNKEGDGAAADQVRDD